VTIAREALEHLQHAGVQRALAQKLAVEHRQLGGVGQLLAEQQVDDFFRFKVRELGNGNAAVAQAFDGVDIADGARTDRKAAQAGVEVVARDAEQHFLAVRGALRARARDVFASHTVSFGHPPRLRGPCRQRSTRFTRCLPGAGSRESPALRTFTPCPPLLAPRYFAGIASATSFPNAMQPTSVAPSIRRAKS